MKEINLNPFNNKVLKNLEIVFENCEVFNVPANGIEWLGIEKITHDFIVHVNRYNKGKFTNKGEITSFSNCKRVTILLNKTGQRAKSNFKEIYKENESCLLKDRLKSKDITQLEFHFADNTMLNVLVPWEDGESEYVNKLIKINKEDDNICIEIN